MMLKRLVILSEDRALSDRPDFGRSHARSESKDLVFRTREPLVIETQGPSTRAAKSGPRSLRMTFVTENRELRTS
jgi:hypothetical protein